MAQVKAPIGNLLQLGIGEVGAVDILQDPPLPPKNPAFWYSSPWVGPLFDSGLTL